MNNSIIKLQNVRKELSIKSDGQVLTTVILPNVSMEIYEGEFASITGASGSGKTTMLYLMGGLDKPNSGKIFLDGDEITSKNEEELAAIRNKKLGFVYQFHFLLPEFTSLENVVMPMLARGEVPLNKAKERAKELLDRVGMSNRLNNKPNQLSGGQQQRVAIARALAMRPKVLLADEPTGNLDSKNSELIINLFDELNKTTGQTIVVVTHDEHFASLTRRRIHLVDGEIDNDSRAG